MCPAWRAQDPCAHAQPLPGGEVDGQDTVVTGSVAMRPRGPIHASDSVTGSVHGW
jgi:hypothetical protein